MTNYLSIQSKNDTDINGFFSYFRGKQNPITDTLIKATSSSIYQSNQAIENVLSDDSSFFTSDNE